MGKSTCLRLSDVEAVHRVVNECRELWAEPAAWRQQLVVGASRLTGMAVVHYSDYSVRGSGGGAVKHCAADVGWRDAPARAIFLVAAAAHPDPFKFFPGSERFQPRLDAGHSVALLRAEMCFDDEWYRSHIYNEFRRPAHLDDNVVSVIPSAPGRFSILDLSQDVAEARPTERTKRQLELLHRLVEPLIGVQLSTELLRSMHALSPQLRATLEQLLEGRSEKEIAARLGLRPPTVHEYIGKIYRHFDVECRAELMAYFIRRRPKGR